ncbi:unnamed protein product, partial [marine sediment metagenome]
MLITETGWVEIVEINPPQLPDVCHLKLEDSWGHVLVT